jgi:monoterpene epsilon-lactone hydrolase
VNESTNTSGPPEVAPLQVPARCIPAPMTISAEARGTLVPSPDGFGADGFPAPDDIAGWQDMMANAVLSAPEHIITGMAARLGRVQATSEAVEVAGVSIFDTVPAGAYSERIHLDIHGGALIFGGGEICQMTSMLAAHRFGLRTWSVNYRMPPEHPYPAPLDDCLAVYRALLEAHDPDRIVVSGTSAGGNLAAALMLRARDEGLPLPAALFLFTPEVDLTESGDTFNTLMGIDTVLTHRLMPINLLYAAGQPLDDPYLSPLFGDFATGFPPTFLTAGTRDLFLSNTVRMHRRLREAGVSADLHVFEAMPHSGFVDAPEDDELDAEVRRYLDGLWS